MVHIRVSRIDWVDYFTVLGKYIHTKKNGTVWAQEGYLHPHSWKWAIPTPQVGSGQGTGWPYFVKSPIAKPGTKTAASSWPDQHTIQYRKNSNLLLEKKNILETRFFIKQAGHRCKSPLVQYSDKMEYCGNITSFHQRVEETGQQRYMGPTMSQVCKCLCRYHSRYGLTQWETMLYCNTVSHWMSSHLELTLVLKF